VGLELELRPHHQRHIAALLLPVLVADEVVHRARVPDDDVGLVHRLAVEVRGKQSGIDLL
jgi:hypothetical protein